MKCCDSSTIVKADCDWHLQRYGPMIEEIAKHIPEILLDESGSVFYSGRSAFDGNAPLYVLGANPGGDPELQSDETVLRHTNMILKKQENNWSAYRVELWRGVQPGKWSMQPRVLHLLNHLNLDPGNVPSSNVVFVRSSRLATLKSNYRALADICWPFHKTVIELLEPPLVLCFGRRGGNYVRRKLHANKQVDEFEEMNRRKWKSHAYINENGLVVVVATHPSIADWTSREADPSYMIKQVLRNNI